MLIAGLPAVPASRNSYPDFLRLGAGLKLDDTEASAVRRCADDPGCEAKGLEAALARHAGALRALDAFRGKRFQPPEWSDIAKIGYETPIPRLMPVAPAPSSPRVWTHPEFWRGNPIGVILHAIGTPNWNATLRRRCEESFWIEGTKAALAARAFAADRGRMPRSLAELAPKYLAQVPVDPFGGKPLELSADGRLVSAGADRDGKPLRVQLPGGMSGARGDAGLKARPRRAMR